MVDVIKAIPDFTQDESLEKSGVQEPDLSGQTADEQNESAETEKETPSTPPVEEKPAREQSRDNTAVLEQTVQGLQEEKTSLLKEIASLRGQKREIAQQELQKVENKLDELKDVHPEDAQLVERIIRSKGYVRQDEVHKMFYKAVQDESLTKFLEKYPEYKPENDSNDSNWNALQKELAWYKMPDNPHQVVEILERAHRSISKNSGDRSLSSAIKQQQVKLAGAGSGGTQRSSSKITVSLSPQRRAMLEQGGWSEEEIKKIEQNLEE